MDRDRDRDMDMDREGDRERGLFTPTAKYNFDNKGRKAKMKKNLSNWIKKGRKIIDKNKTRDMTLEEIRELYRNNGHDIYNLINDAFSYGVCTGYKINKIQKKGGKDYGRIKQD